MCEGFIYKLRVSIGNIRSSNDLTSHHKIPIGRKVPITLGFLLTTRERKPIGMQPVWLDFYFTTSTQFSGNVYDS